MNHEAARRSVRARIALATLLLLGTGGTAFAQALEGVNLAGAANASSKLPGVYGRDYIYPNAGEVAYYAGKGMNVFRISVLWERLQPTLNGPLDQKELGRLAQLVADIHRHGGAAVIDIHDYGRYRGVPIGQGNVTVATFADLWTRLAQVFGHDDDVLFGLMNEPQLQQASLWEYAQQQAIDAIRATGADNRILVSGIGWDGAHNFVALSSATLGALTDPRHRLVYEVHQYFDPDSSGTTPQCVSPDKAVQSLASFTQWLRAGKRQGFLGEFGVSRQPQCLADLDKVVAYMHANADVWLGWTYWAGGPWWGNYMFALDPAQGKDRPQMLVLEKYLHPDAKTN